MPDPPARRSLEETWQRLEADGLGMPRGPDGRPLIPPAMPNYDDDGPRFSFFRGHWEGADFSALTLPRTYFARSSFARVDFRNTDLSESRMCWNGFDFCDFRGADLSGCDLRASTFTACLFSGADFRGADLRRSLFEGCDFGDADLTFAISDEESVEAGGLFDYLSDGQRGVVQMADDPGPEPDGG